MSRRRLHPEGACTDPAHAAAKALPNGVCSRCARKAYDNVKAHRCRERRLKRTIYGTDLYRAQAEYVDAHPKRKKQRTDPVAEPAAAQPPDRGLFDPRRIAYGRPLAFRGESDFGDLWVPTLQVTRTRAT